MCLCLHCGTREPAPGNLTWADDPGEGSAGVYRMSATTGATTLAATLPLKHVWSLVEGLSAFDPVTKTYIFWGTDETSVSRAPPDNTYRG